MDRSNVLAVYLVGLAILQQNGKTYVNREIEIAMKELQKELKLVN
ncbi:hypothetical protein R4Z09_10805 [Niallia oryzisoli]|uniref:Uncharacterized protein n=1 Tax=Niallia oryzisoli TaxID=1737571 RepID=A0ABZ2CM66_9BACI